MRRNLLKSTVIVIKQFGKSKLGVAGLVIIFAFAFMAIAAPILTPYDPNKTFLTRPFQPPSLEHPLGTDDAGRDVLSQIIYGSRVSLLIGISAAIVGTLLGTTIGLFSGYFGGVVDTVLMRITDVFMIIPMVPLAILLALYIGPSLFNIVILLGFLGWPGIARQIRSQVLSLREAQFIEAIRALGAGNVRIMFVHILPNVVGLMIANMIGGAVGAIMAESGLAFLGVTDPRNISWGRIISRSLGSGAVIKGAWWTLLPPGICIALLACGFSFFSHGLMLLLTPRLRGQ
jgi:ABC-type dipeptide/oligopeptide/nickel transport system permease subunit